MREVREGKGREKHVYVDIYRQPEGSHAKNPSFPEFSTFITKFLFEQNFSQSKRSLTLILGNKFADVRTCLLEVTFKDLLK